MFPILPLLLMQTRFNRQDIGSSLLNFDTDMLEEIAEYTPGPARKNIKALCAFGKCMKEESDNKDISPTDLLKMIDVVEKYSKAQTPLMLIRLMLSTGNFKNIDNSPEGMMSVLSTVLPYSMRKNMPDIPTLMNMMKIMQAMNESDDEDDESDEDDDEEAHLNRDTFDEDDEDEEFENEDSQDERLKDIQNIINNKQLFLLKQMLNNKK